MKAFIRLIFLRVLNALVGGKSWSSEQRTFEKASPPVPSGNRAMFTSIIVYYTIEENNQSFLPIPKQYILPLILHFGPMPSACGILFIPGRTY